MICDANLICVGTVVFLFSLLYLFCFGFIHDLDTIIYYLKGKFTQKAIVAVHSKTRNISKDMVKKVHVSSTNESEYYQAIQLFLCAHKKTQMTLFNRFLSSDSL